MALEDFLKRPRLRGRLHQVAFFISILACAILIAKTQTRIGLIASIIYSIGVLSMFGISALYHRVFWEKKPRAIMKRLDHSAIFILIAGSFTPVCLFALSEQDGQKLLILIWSIAVLGVLKSVFWVSAPKPVSALFYVIMGWLGLPYISEFNKYLGTENVAIILAGGIFYSIGAAFYALRKPKLSPIFFSYHELFHAFTIIAAALHFYVVYQICQ